MAVGLVTHIPDQLVVGSVEDIVDGHGQLHHAEAGTEVPRMLRGLLDDELPQLVAQLGQRPDGQFAQIFDRLDL